jgi:hypothetical protein
VQWTTFRAQTPVEGSGDGSQSDLGQAAHDLRHSGQFGFHERENELLWYFVLSGPNIARDSQVQAKATVVSDVIARHALSS